MDRRKLLLLKYLLNHCNEGYKVLDTKEVMNSIKKYKGNFEIFSKDIDYLSQMNYIDLKYIDDVNFCLTIKDNSRILQENIKLENDSKKSITNLMLFMILISGIMSFVGSFLAIILFK